MHILELTLTVADCTKSAICCLDCGRTLEWTRHTSDETEMFFKCIHCVRAPNLLRFDPRESADKIQKLLITENIQLASSALHLVLNSSRYINALLLPPIPDNPVDILCDYNDKISNGFKFGGGDSSIVIADLYEIPNCHQYAVLIVSDTGMVPTRYYLHALHFRIDGKMDKKFLSEQLLDELTAVGNMVIKPGSILVLGPNLQNWISAETYAKEKHNLKCIVPFDELTVLDSSNQKLDVAQNFQQILRDAITICDAIRRIFNIDAGGINCKNEISLRDKLQVYLTTAIWMRYFNNTPFNYFLYHCAKETLFL